MKKFLKSTLFLLFSALTVNAATNEAKSVIEVPYKGCSLNPKDQNAGTLEYTCANDITIKLKNASKGANPVGSPQPHSAAPSAPIHPIASPQAHGTVPSQPHAPPPASNPKSQVQATPSPPPAHATSAPPANGTSVGTQPHAPVPVANQIQKPLAAGQVQPQTPPPVANPKSSATAPAPPQPPANTTTGPQPHSAKPEDKKSTPPPVNEAKAHVSAGTTQPVVKPAPPSAVVANPNPQTPSSAAAKPKDTAEKTLQEAEMSGLFCVVVPSRPANSDEKEVIIGNVRHLCRPRKPSETAASPAKTQSKGVNQ